MCIYIYAICLDVYIYMYIYIYVYIVSISILYTCQFSENDGDLRPDLSLALENHPAKSDIFFSQIRGLLMTSL